jgi:hypothetical protein
MSRKNHLIDNPNEFIRFINVRRKEAPVAARNEVGARLGGQEMRRFPRSTSVFLPEFFEERVTPALARDCPGTDRSALKSAAWGAGTDPRAGRKTFGRKTETVRG